MYEVTSPTNSGRVIAVWSPVSRQGGVSTLAALLASYICRTHTDEKVLILSNETDGAPTAEQYITRDKGISGLAEVIELAISDNLHNPDDMYNNAHNIISNLDALTCNKENTNVSDFLDRELEDVLKLARRSYRYTIIDTVSGQYSMTTQDILKLSDCVVVGLPQDKYIFDNWVREMPSVYPSFLKPDRLVAVASCYFDYSHMRYQDMRKEMKGKPLYYVNQNSAVHKAVSECNVLDFISAEVKIKKGHDDVIDEIKAILDRVEEILVNVVNEEIEAEAKAAEERENENKAYIENHASFYSDDLYADPNEGELSDMEEGFDLYGSSQSEPSTEDDSEATSDTPSEPASLEDDLYGNSTVNEIDSGDLYGDSSASEGIEDSSEDSSTETPDYTPDYAPDDAFSSFETSAEQPLEETQEEETGGIDLEKSE